MVAGGERLKSFSKYTKVFIEQLNRKFKYDTNNDFFIEHVLLACACCKVLKFICCRKI